MGISTASITSEIHHRDTKDTEDGAPGIASASITTNDFLSVVATPPYLCAFVPLW